LATDTSTQDKPTPCPGCAATMRPQHLASKITGELTVDLCADCQAIWFDAFESTQLAPGATLQLFEAIRTARPAMRRPPPATLPCPRCTLPLALTQDVQHTTRFSYYRCASGHGRLTPFAQFLREKDFIRAPTPAELARLKASIRQISCSSCGAPIDLERDAACPYCRAPIAILDPDAVAATIRALQSAEAKRTSVDVPALVEAMLDAQREARGSTSWSVLTHQGSSATIDLVRLGLDAIAAYMTR
jgi:hypothetical protein